MKKNLLLLVLFSTLFLIHINAQTISATLKLKMFIEGYIDVFNPLQMVSVLANEGITTSNSYAPATYDVDTVTVYLVDPSNKDTVATAKGLLQTNGSLSVPFTSVPSGTNNYMYYLAMSQRGMASTWSALPISIYNGQSYDFTMSQNQAYGNNQTDDYGNGIWSFYSGDWNQDGNVDALDFPAFDYEQQNFYYGYYSQDLNGDGNVDIYDYREYDNNLINFVSSKHP